MPHPPEPTLEARPANRPLAYLTRLAAIACVLAGSWYMLHLYFRVVGGGTTPAPELADEDRGAALEPLAHLPLGAWQLGDQPWQMRVTPVDAEAVEGHLRQPPAVALPSWSAAEGMLLGLVKSSARLRAGAKGLTVYGADEGRLRWRAYSQTRDGRERLLAGRLAFAGPVGWQVLEITPDPGKGAGKAGRLLPWPAGCQQVARRADDDGELLAELVLLGGSLDGLCRDLRQDGWSVAGSGPLRECRRGDMGVQLWAPPKRDGGQVLLALRLTVRSEERKP